MAKLVARLPFIGILAVVCVQSLSSDDFGAKVAYDEIPDHTKYAAVARYVVHKSVWASMGTISTSKNLTGFPMVNIKSIADSAKDEPSTGRIYFYLMNMDLSTIDLQKNNKLTIMLSNDQDLECTKKGIDAMDPSCARLMISGSAVKVDVNSDEYEFGNRAFVSRHPVAKDWFKQHSFVLCKLDIKQIIILDWYADITYVNVEDYYNATDSLNGFTAEPLSTKREAHNKNTEKNRIKIIVGGDEAVVIEL